MCDLFADLGQRSGSGLNGMFDSIRYNIIFGSSPLLSESMYSSQSIFVRLIPGQHIRPVVQFLVFDGPTGPVFVPKGLAYTRPHKFWQAFSINSFSKLGHTLRAKTKRRTSYGRIHFSKRIFFKNSDGSVEMLNVALKACHRYA